MRIRSSWPFMGALLSAGALGVHQLRFGLAYGDGAGSALAASGHGYLTWAEPLIGLTLAFALGHAAWRIVAGGRTHATNRRRLAAIFALTLLLVYTGQELLEGELAAGHASGFAGVFGAGGWIAVPLALVLGALMSLAIQLVDAAAEAVAARATVSRPRPQVPEIAWVGAVIPFSGHAPPLARHLAGRAPPLLLSH